MMAGPAPSLPPPAPGTAPPERHGSDEALVPGSGKKPVDGNGTGERDAGNPNDSVPESDKAVDA